MSTVVFIGGSFAGEPLILDPSISPTYLTGNIQVWGWNIAAASLEKLVPPFCSRTRARFFKVLNGDLNETAGLIDEALRKG